MAKTRHSPAGYSLTQIVLHWLVAAMVIFQVLFGEDIADAYRAFRKGTVPSAESALDANIHVYVGLGILALAVLRLVLRFTQGVPEAPSGESATQKLIAAATHIVLYLALLVMPLTGGLAWYLGMDEAGELHEIGKPVIIVFVALHVIGALWQHFGQKSDVLVRMLRPRTAKA